MVFQNISVRYYSDLGAFEKQIRTMTYLSLKMGYDTIKKRALRIFYLC